MKKVNVYKTTSDNWHPSFQLKDGTQLVRVSFTQTGPNPPHNGEWRVCVWGDDDCGMEKDFLEEIAAQAMFLEVIALADVNKQGLKKLGFVSA